ncbi:MAG TPA: hypothetical protein VIT92_06945 [Burkholderiaceae bacterium]
MPTTDSARRTPRQRLKALRRPHRYTLVACAIGLAATIVACGGSESAPTFNTPPATTPPGAVTPPPVLLPSTVNGPAWTNFGRDAQHTGQSAIASQPLTRILWQTPVDIVPQYSERGYLLTHYGSPVITSKNTVLVPVKGTLAGGFRVEARAGFNSAQIWTMNSDYLLPAHEWKPSYNITLTANNRVLAPGAGGKVLYRDDADSATSANQSLVFYGDAVYQANKAAMDASVAINTPITADKDGNIYFGFVVQGSNPAGLTSGFARIGADGKANWVSARATAGEAVISKPAMNSAPALSNDQKTLYVVVNGEPFSTTRYQAYLLALDSTTLALKSKVQLLDPSSATPARASDDGTASPAIGPDGDVFIGVLETTAGRNNSRGWLLHFNAALTQEKTPGAFGWDITPSIVPAAMVPSYKGSSSYLLMTKYNNYGRSGTGDGRNRIAILDPTVSMRDPISQLPVMQEVLTILAPTRDPNVPGGVIEWCINTAAVDPFTKSVLVNSEDGYLYRWDLNTNTLSEKIQLTSGLGESYTPTAIGPDGTVFAINNAILFALGK